MPRVHRSDASIDDLIETWEFIAVDSVATADRFVDVTTQEFERLAQSPGMGTLTHIRRPHLRTLRFWPVPGFEKWLILYRPAKDGVEILRVIHGARDWRRIVKKSDR